MIQVRNFFRKDSEFGPHCTIKRLNVSHIATGCKNLLTSYTSRHDEVVRCIHLKLCRDYKFSENKKLKNHQITKVIENAQAKIITDMNILVNKNIRENKLDIVIFDKINKKIKIIEVGITNKDRLQKTESLKKQKYVHLGNELSQTYKMQVEIIPFVMTWDGIVTKFNEKYRKD